MRGSDMEALAHMGARVHTPHQGSLMRTGPTPILITLEIH